MQTSDYLSRCVLGTAGLGGVWGHITPQESINAILMALQNGITSIDTAPAYGDAEYFTGVAINQWEGDKPLISTKVGRLKTYNAADGKYDYGKESMIKSVENSLKTLAIEKIDILFLHDPGAIPEKDAELILENLVQFKKDGYTKKIGLGGNSPAWFKKYISGEVFDVVMEYNRLNVCCTEALSSSLPDYKSRGIDFYAASPLYMGLLGNRFDEFRASPPEWLQKSMVERAEQVKIIADKYLVPLPSLAHRFLLSIPENFKIVIGSKDLPQLRQTISDFRKGPLPKNIIEDINP